MYVSENHLKFFIKVVLKLSRFHFCNVYFLIHLSHDRNIREHGGGP